jgi:hypothetical protein
MKNWYASVYKALIMASVVAFIISFYSTGTVSLGALLSGYSVLILAVMMILLILFNNVIKVKTDASTLNVILSILSSSGPFLLMLGVIGLILYLIIRYQDIIVSGHVSNNYYTFSNIAIMLFLIQIYIVYTNIASDKFQITGKISPSSSSLIYLFGILTCLCSLILFNVLTYFTTDGFTVSKIN